MSNQDTNILQSGQARFWVQSAANPANAFGYQGCVSLGGIEQDLGEGEPIYCPSTTQRNKWDIVGTTVTTQSLGTSDFTFRVSRFLSDIWFRLKRQNCFFNAQVLLGSCQNPSDFTQWDSKIHMPLTRLTNLSLGELNSLSGDDNTAVEGSGSLQFRDYVPIKPLVLGERADSTIAAEVLDVQYNDTVNCGECGTASDGCQKIYALTLANGGSPGLSSQVVYSADGGSTWASLDIPTLGGLSANRFAAVGTNLVVVSQATGSHHYQSFTDVDSGTNSWVASSSGYVANKAPRAIYSKSPSETFIAGAGGYIYFMTSPSAAVEVSSDGSVSTQQLNAIHGYGNTIVAVGNTGAIIKSSNVGDTWSAVSAPSATNINAIWCVSETIYFIGLGNGKLYYTLNGGTSWVEITLAGSPSVINDIVFVNNGGDFGVGYIAAEVGGGARIYRSTDLGYSWQYQAPSISNQPSTSVRINRLAVCWYNEVVAGGRKTAGGDGIIVQAKNG